MTDLTALEATGRATGHLANVGDGIWLHRHVLGAFRELAADAAGEGMALRIASGFRSFDRQCRIWNRKARGQAPVLDDHGRPRDMGALSDRDKVFAILRWSALPGASRHHWGTDMDIWDAAAVDADYRLQLVAAEYSPGGPFHKLDRWLARLENDGEIPFFRPYDRDRGGVGPEPWHLSYRPLAEPFERAVTVEALRAALGDADIALRDTVLDNLEEIHARFVRI